MVPFSLPTFYPLERIHRHLVDISLVIALLRSVLNNRTCVNSFQYTYKFSDLRSLDPQTLYEPLLSIPASGVVPKKKSGNSVRALRLNGLAIHRSCRGSCSDKDAADLSVSCTFLSYLLLSVNLLGARWIHERKGAENEVFSNRRSYARWMVIEANARSRRSG